MRLIDAYKAASHLMARLIETANNNVGYVCDAGSVYEDVADRVPHWIEEVPKIDAAPVATGRWEPMRTIYDPIPALMYTAARFESVDDWIQADSARCSRCGFVYHNWECDRANFCPECGARMKP